MPHERARSLHWAWEFLLELQLTPQQRVQVPYVLRHYPQPYTMRGIEELIARAPVEI